VSCVGNAVTEVWVDEASDVDQRVLNTLRRKAEFVAQLSPPAPPPLQIKPTVVPCTYCGANAGEKCRRWHGVKQLTRRGPHPSRLRDFKLLRTAAKAMIGR
jgi:hypothetical protein